MKKCSTVSFEGQVIFVGIDVHKESWAVNLRHCHPELDKFSMNPSPEMLAKIRVRTIREPNTEAFTRRDSVDSGHTGVYVSLAYRDASHPSFCCVLIRERTEHFRLGPFP